MIAKFIVTTNGTVPLKKGNKIKAFSQEVLLACSWKKQLVHEGRLISEMNLIVLLAQESRHIVEARWRR